MQSNILTSLRHIHTMLPRDTKIQLALLTFLSTISCAFEVIVAITLMRFITDPNIHNAYLAGGIYLCKNILALYEARYKADVLHIGGHLFKIDLLTKLLGDHCAQELMTNDTAYFMHLINSCCENMFVWGIAAINVIISEAMVLGVFCLILAVKSFTAFLGVCFIGAITALLVWVFITPKIEGVAYFQEVHLARANDELTQVFDCFKAILLYGLAQRFIASFAQENVIASAYKAKLTHLKDIPKSILELIVVAGIIIYLLVYRPDYDIVIGLLYLCFRISAAISRVMGQLANFKAVLPAIEKVWSKWELAPCG